MTAAGTPLRVLLVEDMEIDGLLIQRELTRGGFQLTLERVQAADTMAAALAAHPWDVVVSDHSMPHFSAVAALEISRAFDPDLPFLIVSGAVPEEIVTDAMRAGARDFISKSNLVRLVPAIRRELGESSTRRAKRRLTEQLVESEHRYASLFTDSPAPMLLIEARGLFIVDANPAASDFLGYALDTLRTASVPALSTLYGAKAWKVAQHAKGQHGHRFSDQVRLSDGTSRDVDIFAVQVIQGGRSFLLATLFDQSQRRTTELALQESQTRFQILCDSAPMLIWTTDAEGRTDYVNHTLLDFSGRPLEGELGTAWEETIHPEDLARVRQAQEESHLRRTPCRVEYRRKREDGAYRWMVGQTSPRFTALGAFAGSIGSSMDITDRKLAEDRLARDAELERQMRQVQKMGALEALASGVAHDFNNVLATILTASELLKAKLPPGSPLLSKVDAILNAGMFASGLNKQLLAFSHRGKDLRIPIDLTAHLRDTLRLLRATIPLQVEIRSELTSGIWVEGDPTHIQQVMLNLGINAYHAMKPAGGLLEIALGESVLPGGVPSASLPGGRYAILTVTDSGCGMDPSVMERIFEPFYTTKGEGGGGLGLSVVHAIMAQMGGSIQVASAPGRGTTFSLLFPCATGRSTTELESVAEDLTGQETILFVDDEDILAALAKQGLQELGYKVITRGTGEEALELLRAGAGGVDLVFTDLAMPGLDGAALAGQIMELRPDLPVILVSGQPPAVMLAVNARTAFRGVVTKPFTIQELANQIRKVLPRGEGRAQERIGQSPWNEPAQGAPRGQILLAEDSQTTRAMIRKWLERAGYQVQEARDGLEAWELLSSGRDSGRYGLLLTDVVMPRMDGLELTQLARQADPTLPVAVLTTNEDQETVKSAIHAGASEYLNKPFSAGELLACVERLLRTQHTYQEARRSAETAQAVRMAQRALLAAPEKDLPVYSLYEPLSDAGGDVLRCVRSADGSILFVLVDVAGHSVGSSYAVAAFLAILSNRMGECRHLKLPGAGPAGCEEPLFTRDCGFFGHLPCDPLRHLALKLNHDIQAGPFSEVPVCALFGRWDPATGSLDLLNAGIPHGLLCGGKAEARRIEINGTPLGIFPEPILEDLSMVLAPGQRVLFATDGFFDVTDAGSNLFHDQAPAQWQRLEATPIDWAISIICEAARSHGEGRIADDLLVMGFEQPMEAPSPLLLSLSIPSTSRGVDLACDRLDAFLAQDLDAGTLTRSRLFDIRLAVREALMNAVHHGNGDAPDARVALECAIDGARTVLEARIRDGGPGFTLSGAPADNPLSDRGRGLTLMRAFASELRVQGGEVILTFRMEEASHGCQQERA